MEDIRLPQSVLEITCGERNNVDVLLVILGIKIVSVFIWFQLWSDFPPMASSGLIRGHVFAILLIMILLFVFEYWSGTVVVKCLSLVFSLVFIWRVYIHSFEFGINRQVFGGEDHRLFLPDLSLRKAVGLFRGFAETGEDRLMFALTCYAVAIGIAGVVANRWWLAISLLLFSLTSAHSIRRTWPGFTLVLGSSQDQGFRGLLYRVMLATRPFNTTTMVNFLKPEDLERELDLVLQDRVRNIVVSWEAAAEVHASLAKVIVISLDDLRDAVTTELQLIDRKSLWYKTIVFSRGSVGDILATISPQLVPSVAGALVTSDISEVKSAIRSVKQRHATFPSPVHPISKHQPDK